MTLPFKYTGDPFVDVGVATLLAGTEVSSINDLREDAITAFIEEVTDVYINQTMSNYLGTVVFANVNFANPGLNTNPKFDPQRRHQLGVWLSVWKEGAAAFDRLEKKDRAKIELAREGEGCVFSGDPAVVRVSRTLIPMTGSETAINFVPEGRPLLPVAGWVLLALLVMPMGTINSGGRILLAHTADHNLLQKLVKRNLKVNREAFGWAKQGSLSKRPNYRFARTQLMSALLDIDYRASSRYPLTMYHFSSSGQDAKLTIHTLSSLALRFVKLAKRRYPAAWDAIVARAWSVAKRADERPEPNDKGEMVDERRNYFYEDLFDLPTNAGAFLRRYLLRMRAPANTLTSDKNDPSRSYSPLTDRAAISWDLITLFLEKVMHMEKNRVEAIRKLAERLAIYIQQEDPRLYGRLYRDRRPDRVRMELIRACDRAKSKGLEQLVPYEEYIEAFFVHEENGYLREDWWLAGDLLLIGIIDHLSADVLETNRADIENADQKSMQLEDDTIIQ